MQQQGLPRVRPDAGRLLLMEAAASLTAAYVLLSILPFKRAMRLSGLGRVVGDKGSASVPDVPSKDIAVAMSVGEAIERSARHMPFRALCLQQALACALMLRRRHLPSVVRFGVFKKAGGVLEAHAWTLCGDAVVTGARGMERFTPIAAFSR